MLDAAATPHRRGELDVHPQQVLRHLVAARIDPRDPVVGVMSSRGAASSRATVADAVDDDPGTRDGSNRTV